MSRFVRWLAAGLTVVWMSFQASAQTQSATPKVVWNLDWIDNHCAITTGSADSMGLSLRVVPGDPDPERLVLVRVEVFRDLCRGFDGNGVLFGGSAEDDSDLHLIHVAARFRRSGS